MTEIVGLLRGANNNNDNLYASIEANRKFRIGRQSDNDLVIAHNIISLHHCEIIAKRDYANDITIVYLTDLSINGTYLNGSLIGQNRTVILISGSIISFASEHLNMMYIEKRNNLPYDEEVQVRFVPGSLLHPEQHDTTAAKEIKNTSKAIGCGAQADVFLAYDRIRTRDQLACKRIQLVRNRSYRNIFQTETAILKQNRHMNVLSLVALLKKRDKIYFFLPLYTGGTLSEKMNKRMNEKKATFIFDQILSGLKYIHEKGIIHCDLKAENILLGSPNNWPRIIISDFGLSMFKPEPKQLWPDCYGTFRNHAPEIFKHELFDEKVDCWAAGLIFYSLLFGYHPFMKPDDSDTATIEDHSLQRSILNDEPDYHEELNISVPARYIISKLLEKDPDERYSCEQCLKVNKIHWSTELDTLRVLKEYQYERYLWFQDEENPYSAVTTNDGDHSSFTDGLKELRSTKGPTSIITCKRGVMLDEDNNDGFLEDIKKAKYPKLNLENFKKKY